MGSMGLKPGALVRFTLGDGDLYEGTVAEDGRTITDTSLVSVSAPQFCTVRPGWCRLGDSHDGQCAP